MSYTAFNGEKKLLSGDAETLVLGIKHFLDENPEESVLVFDDASGNPVDFDLQGSDAEVLAKLQQHPLLDARQRPSEPRPGRGRPRLGVVAREVTLLPRHWQWLAQQRGGASAALRRLIDDKRKSDAVPERTRRVWDATGRFMWAMAGNQPGFEEASRALYAHDKEALDEQTGNWPRDIRAHLQHMLSADDCQAKNNETL